MRMTRIMPVALFLLTALPAAVIAQEQHVRRADWPSVRQMLAHFEQVQRGTSRGSLGAISAVLTRPDSFPPAMVDSLLDGLQRLATTSDHPQVQNGALSWLAGAGRESQENPIPGVVERLEAVYEQACSPVVRKAAVRQLGSQAERTEAVQVLRVIATQDSSRQRAPEAANEAVWGLTHLGPEGQSALREIHSRGLVRERTARNSVRDIAVQRGWEAAPQDENR